MERKVALFIRPRSRHVTMTKHIGGFNSIHASLPQTEMTHLLCSTFQLFFLAGIQIICWVLHFKNREKIPRETPPHQGSLSTVLRREFAYNKQPGVEREPEFERNSSKTVQLLVNTIIALSCIIMRSASVCTM